MSLLNKYAQKEQLLKQLQQELQDLENNQELQKDLEFKEHLEMLMTEYGKTTRDVKEVLFPTAYDEPKAKATRKVRKLKVYKNPHTGEEISTRGGNHKGLKQWKDEYGDEVVEGWLINEDADNQPTPDVTPPVDGKQEEKAPEAKDQKKEEKKPAEKDEAKQEKAKG